MAALPATALITVTVNSASGPLKIPAGETISDSVTLAGYQGAGGQVAPQSDPIVAAAVLIVAKLRAKGRNEEEWNSVMLAAAAASAEASLTINQTIALGATADIQLEPSPAEAGTVLGATVTTFLQPATGESVVVQIRKNQTNITGATVTISSTTVANKAITIPNMVGVAYLPTDEFDANLTYTAGGGPLPITNGNISIKGQ